MLHEGRVGVGRACDDGLIALQPANSIIIVQGHGWIRSDSMITGANDPTSRRFYFETRPGAPVITRRRAASSTASDPDESDDGHGAKLRELQPQVAELTRGERADNCWHAQHHP